MKANTTFSKFTSLFKSPIFITILILVIFTLIAFLRIKDYGLTWDEPVQTLYGLESLHWYVTRGADLRFLYIGEGLQYHGAFAEWFIALFQVLTHHFWGVRSIITILFGVSGLAAITLCGFEIKKPWIGVVALLMLILFPRYSGDIFTNSKDIPFAASYAFVLWGAFHLINTWHKKYNSFISSIIVGILIGISAAIRVVAVIWWPILGIIAITYLAINFKEYKREGTLKIEIFKILASGLLILLFSFSVLTILWPFVLMSPIHNFIEAVRDMSHFPFSTPITFNGQIINPTYTPREFSIVWILIATPIASIIFFFVGLFIYIKKSFKNYINPYITIAILSIIIPLLVIIVLDSTLYSGIRQILFVIPSILLIASYGFIEAICYLKNKRRIFMIVFILGVILYYGNVFYITYELHPYEYLYFNEFVGGLKGAYGKYELDYWGASYMACSEWLGTNYPKYTDAKIIHVSPNTTDHVQIMKYLPSNFVVDNTTPNFYITLVWDQPGMFENQYPKSKVIYQVSRLGTPLCEVKLVNPNSINTKVNINPIDYSSTWESWVKTSWKEWAQP